MTPAASTRELMGPEVNPIEAAVWDRSLMAPIKPANKPSQAQVGGRVPRSSGRCRPPVVFELLLTVDF